MFRKQFYKLTKASPSKIYSGYVNDLDKIRRECWKTYKNKDNNPEFTINDKLLALRTMSEITKEVNDKKLSMFQEDNRP